MNFGRRDALFQIDEVSLKINLFDGPGVLDAIAKHVVEDRETHGAQCEAETGVEDVRGCRDGGVGGVFGHSDSLSMESRGNPNGKQIPSGNDNKKNKS